MIIEYLRQRNLTKLVQPTLHTITNDRRFGSYRDFCGNAVSIRDQNTGQIYLATVAHNFDGFSIASKNVDGIIAFENNDDKPHLFVAKTWDLKKPVYLICFNPDYSLLCVRGRVIFAQDTNQANEYLYDKGFISILYDKTTTKIFPGGTSGGILGGQSGGVVVDGSGHALALHAKSINGWDFKYAGGYNLVDYFQGRTIPDEINFAQLTIVGKRTDGVQFLSFS